MQKIKIILIGLATILLLNGCDAQPYYKPIKNSSLIKKIFKNSIELKYDTSKIILYRIPVYKYGDNISQYKLQPNFKAYLTPDKDKKVYAIVEDNNVVGYAYSDFIDYKLNAHSLNVNKLEKLFYCIRHGLFYQEGQTTYFYMKYTPYNMKPRVKAAELFFAPVNYYHDILRNLESRDSLAREVKEKGYQKNKKSFPDEKWQNFKQRAIKTKYEPKLWQDTAPQNLRKEYKFRFIPSFRFTKDVLNYNRETDIRPFIEPDPYALSVIFHRDDTVFFRAEFDFFIYRYCQDHKNDPEVIPYEISRDRLYVSTAPMIDKVDPDGDWFILNTMLTKVQNDTTYFFSFGVNNEIKPITNIKAEDIAGWINGSHYHDMDLYKKIKKWKKKYNYDTQDK